MNAKNEVVNKKDIRLVLSALWTGHFLLWSFGDMLTLLQKMSEPADGTLLMLVAVPLAIIQASMIFLQHVVRTKVMRWINIILAIVYLVFNAGFLFEATVGWEYLLGAGYVAFNLLIMWFAWEKLK